MYVYAVYDKVQEKVINICADENDKSAIRTNAQYFMRILPMKDLELWKIGTMEGLKLTVSSAELLKWSDYDFEENKASALKVFKKPGENEEKIDNEDKKD